MIDRIGTARDILDEEIPGIDSSVLRPTRNVKKLQPLEKTDRKKEDRALEKSERANAPALPGIKITDPMESEVKIDRIKEINRQNPPQFRVSQTWSALRGLARQFRISPQLSSLAGLREFMQMVSRSPQFERIAGPARF